MTRLCGESQIPVGQFLQEDVIRQVEQHRRHRDIARFKGADIRPRLGQPLWGLPSAPLVGAAARVLAHDQGIFV
jgi:hypothetical protein